MSAAISNEDLMRFLDGELSSEERARMEEAIGRSTELQRELAIFRAIQQGVRDLTFAVHPDLSVWDTLDRHLTRPIGWVVFVAGVLLWAAYSVWVFTTSPTNPVEKIAVAAVVIGFLILLLSTIFERVREWRTDPYRDIER